MPTNKLLEISPYETDGGNLIGRDPRKLTGEDFEAQGVELRVPRKAVRAMCLECCGFVESEVRKCVAVHCPLWALRMGGLSRSLRAAIKAKEMAEKNDDDAE